MAYVMKLDMGEKQGGADDYAGAGALSSEAILNVRTVRALVAEPSILKMYDERVQAPYKKELGACLKSGILFGFSVAIMYLLYIVGFLYGGYLVQENAISVTGMFRAIFCTLFGLFGAGIALAGLQDMDSAKLAAYDMFGVIDRKSTIDAITPTGTHKDLGDGSIEFKDVRFAFPHRPDAKVLQGVSFKVEAGNMIALVGPSGSGKSTVIQMLLRFYDPTSGAVLVGGTDLRQFDIAWFRRQTGFVGQEPILFNMSLEDNVKYGAPEATRDEVRFKLHLCIIESFND